MVITPPNVGRVEINKNMYLPEKGHLYHVYTKEGFRLLKLRYLEKYSIAESDFENYIIGPSSACCLASYRSKNQVAEYDLLKEEKPPPLVENG